MFELDESGGAPSRQELLEQARSLLSASRDRVANAANLSSLLYHSLDKVNWVGFYFRQGEQLVVGPFQGKPACVLIPMGKGVCGTAAVQGETQRVADVDAFPGHIACDAASQSEVVVPLMQENECWGVLDVDSPVRERFSQEDQDLFEAIVALYQASVD